TNLAAKTDDRGIGNLSVWRDEGVGRNTRRQASAQRAHLLRNPAAVAVVTDSNIEVAIGCSPTSSASVASSVVDSVLIINGWLPSIEAMTRACPPVPMMTGLCISQRLPRDQVSPLERRPIRERGNSRIRSRRPVRGARARDKGGGREHRY